MSEPIDRPPEVIDAAPDNVRALMPVTEVRVEVPVSVSVPLPDTAPVLSVEVEVSEVEPPQTREFSEITSSVRQNDEKSGG